MTNQQHIVLLLTPSALITVEDVHKLSRNYYRMADRVRSNLFGVAQTLLRLKQTDEGIPIPNKAFVEEVVSGAAEGIAAGRLASQV
jgi:hypothetical protein